MPIERRTRAPAPSACSRAWKAMRIARAVVILSGRMISSSSLGDKVCSVVGGVGAAATGLWVMVADRSRETCVLSCDGAKSLILSRAKGVLYIPIKTAAIQTKIDRKSFIGGTWGNLYGQLVRSVHELERS